MKVLLTGADGQLGRSLQARRPPHWSLHAMTHAQLDITDQAALAAAIGALQPALVINAAAYTAVDEAERHPELAYAVNHRGAAHLAQAACAAGARLVHLSTDYVFDGSADRPYEEGDEARPINVYGASKRSGELAVLQAHPGACVLRTSGVYSEYGRNFVKTMLRLASRGNAEPLRVVNDQRCCPTYAGDLAGAVIALAEGHGCQGIYHYCGATALSWHAFAQLIFLTAHQLVPGMPIPPLQAIASRDYPGAAARPANSVLACGRIEALGVRRPELPASLTAALRVIIPSGCC